MYALLSLNRGGSDSSYIFQFGIVLFFSTIFNVYRDYSTDYRDHPSISTLLYMGPCLASLALCGSLVV